MTKNCIILLAVGITPLHVLSQNISLSKMLSLQKNSLLKIQDYLETNSWKLDKIESLKNADSSVFHLRVSHFIDSVKLSINRRGTYNPNSFYSQLSNTRLEDPAWLEYKFDYKPDDNYSFINTFDIILPKFYLLSAIDLKLSNVEKHNFKNYSIDFNFADDSIYKTFIEDIGALNIPDTASYVMFDEPFITRVYKLVDQVITLQTIKSSVTSYSIQIYSRNDYDFINKADIELKAKKVDFIH